MLPRLAKFAFMSSVFGETLDALYWTETNEHFRAALTEETFHSIEVKIGDKIDLICPRIGDGRDHNGHMYHNIVQVTEDQFRECDTRGGKRLISCDEPEREQKYTVLFQDTNPSPYGLEFTPGQTYYYISTSSGDTAEGLDQKQGGGCATNNMKLAIKVKPEQNEYYIEEEVTSKLIEDMEVTERIIADVAKETTPGSLLMGVGLGAFGVLLLVLIIMAALKVYRKRHPSNDKMLYMSPVDVSRVPLPVHNIVDGKGAPIVTGPPGTTTAYHVTHSHVGHTGHQNSPPPPYMHQGMSYTTLVPCNPGVQQMAIHPSQMNLTHDSSDYQSDHSTNHSYLTRESYPIHNGDVCEV